MDAAQRKDLLNMATRHVRPGSGSAWALLRERGVDFGSAPNLRFLQAHVRFVVVGGLATRLYMPPRMTLDTDILVSGDDLHRAAAALRSAGYRREGPLSIGGSSWTAPGGQCLDLIAGNAPWVCAAIDSAVTGPDGLPYVSLPFLVLLKLDAGRLQDLADVSRMLGAADDATSASVRDIVAKYRPQDIEDLESLRQLGRLEYPA